MSIGIVYWHWWAVGLFLVLLEILLPGAVLLWLGIAAGLTGAVVFAWPDMPPEVMFAVFAVLSVLSVASVHFLRRRRSRAGGVGDGEATLNRRGAQYVGLSYPLEGECRGGRGRVRIGDASWPVFLPGWEGELQAGTVVRITGIEGATLLGEPTGSPK